VTRHEQDEDERVFVAEMVERLGLDLDGDPIPHKPPAPDMELRLRDGRTVGLEVIEAHSEKLAGAWKGTSRVVARRITEELRAQSVNASVPFRIDDDTAMLLVSRRRELERTARLIAEYARDVLSGAEQWFSQAQAQRRGIEYVDLLDVRLADALGPEAALVMTTGPLGPGVIQAAIEKKKRKLASYREFNASEYWLLIVGGLPVSGYVTAGDAASARFVSPFDKTVFLDRGSECIDLDTDLPDPES
jgi:hypothetical protein